MWNKIFYFAMVPMVYAAFAVLVGGLLFKLVMVLLSKRFPGSLAVYPKRVPRPIGVAVEAFAVPAAFRKDKVFWLFIIAFHIAFFLLFIGHLELIREFKVDPDHSAPGVPGRGRGRHRPHHNGALFSVPAVQVALARDIGAGGLPAPHTPVPDDVPREPPAPVGALLRGRRRLRHTGGGVPGISLEPCRLQAGRARRDRELAALRAGGAPHLSREPGAHDDPLLEGDAHGVRVPFTEPQEEVGHGKRKNKRTQKDTEKAAEPADAVLHRHLHAVRALL